MKLAVRRNEKPTKGANQQCVNVMFLLLSFFIVFYVEFLNNTIVKPLYQYPLYCY